MNRKADRLWRRSGREHFLTRQLFTQHLADRGLPPSERNLGRRYRRWVQRQKRKRIMEIIQHILQGILIVATLCWVTTKVMPVAVVQAVAYVLRWTVHVIWTVPVRRFGAVVTLFAWLVALAAFGTWILLTDAITAMHLAAVLKLWIAVLLVWLLLRLLASWMFKPTPLPRRR